MSRVLILIPTFRRPEGLDRLLKRLEEQTSQQSIGVIVAENDPARAAGAETVARVVQAGYRFATTIIFVTEKGVSHVRNALVAKALEDPECEFLAMIDDDEWPAPQWIEELLASHLRFGADVVGGPRVSVFDEKPARSLEYCRYFLPEPYATGPVSIVWGTCNLSIARECLVQAGAPWFDPAFGLGGGEDVDALARLKQLGASFAWSEPAIVFEQVPASRLRFRWIVRRAYRIGNSNMFSQLRWRYAATHRLAVWSRVFAELLVTLAALPFVLPRISHRINGLCAVARVVGKIAALRGIRYLEYS